MSNTMPIMVWAFDDAPKELRELSTNGGDEDWLAVVPKRYAKRYIGWLECPAFGCAHVYEYKTKGLPGYRVIIGAHA